MPTKISGSSPEIVPMMAEEGDEYREILWPASGGSNALRLQLRTTLAPSAP